MNELLIAFVIIVFLIISNIILYYYIDEIYERLNNLRGKIGELEKSELK